MERGATLKTLDRTRSRILFYCANGGAVVQGLARIIEEHITHSSVELIDDPFDSIERHNVGLLLLYGLNRRDGIEMIITCQKAYPDAALGLVVESIGEEVALYGSLLDDCIIQGILPLDYELDVWLAAVSVLLGGGEFYPFSRKRAAGPAPGEPVSVSLAPHRETQVVLGKRQDRFMGLTPRERDILLLISQGHQNKVIADRMRLSEHTVKVHVHNLIAKLRVTNRTQAAVAFLAAEDTQLRSSTGGA